MPQVKCQKQPRAAGGQLLKLALRHAYPL